MTDKSPILGAEGGAPRPEPESRRAGGRPPAPDGAGGSSQPSGCAPEPSGCAHEPSGGAPGPPGKRAGDYRQGAAPYRIIIPQNRADAVKLCYIEKGRFFGDKEMLETYQQINLINGDFGSVNVYLNDMSGGIIFNIQLRTDNKRRFLKSLIKGIYAIKSKVDFFQGGYIDELVEEPPCMSCRYHMLEDNRTRCELGDAPASYIVKSHECPRHRSWSAEE